MKAMVLFSGGVDSTTALALAVEKYGASEVLALSIYYGQKHKRNWKLHRRSSIIMVLPGNSWT